MVFSFKFILLKHTFLTFLRYLILCVVKGKGIGRYFSLEREVTKSSRLH